MLCIRIDDFPDDAECKGLGTPATRAATIEKLIKSGFVERQKKSLVPSNKGISLIAVLPEDIKSPLLTAEWEQKLKLVERGELADSGFMGGIASLTRELVTSHRVPAPEYAALFRETAEGILAPRSYYAKLAGVERPPKMWIACLIYEMFANESYIGNSVRFKTGYLTCKNRMVIDKPEDE